MYKNCIQSRLHRATTRMYKILHMHEGNGCSMNRNDMRSIVYLIIALICFYYLMDDFFGKQKVTNWVNKFIGDFGGIAAPPAPTIETVPAPAADPSAASQPAHASENLSPAPLPLIPDTGTVKIPQPEGHQVWKPKSGSSGWSLNDAFHGFNPFPLGVAGAGAAIVGGAAALTQLPREFGQRLGGAF